MVLAGLLLHNLHPAEPFALLCWHTNILLALETAIRRSEIAELRWRFIDLEKRVAHLPDTKNGNARDVPFSTKAITILSSLKEHSKQTTDKVFDMRADAIIRAFLSIPVLVPRTFFTPPCIGPGVA
jgi:integrase